MNKSNINQVTETPVKEPKKYEFDFDFNSHNQTIFAIGNSTNQAREAAYNTLSDEDKDNLASIELIEIHDISPTPQPTEAELCELPDSLFEFGGNISNLIKAAGYEDSARTVINNNSLWSMSRGELIAWIDAGRQE